MREIIGTARDRHGRKVNIVKCNICGLVAEILPNRTNDCRCQRGANIAAARASRSDEAKQEETKHRSKPRTISKLTLGSIFGVRRITSCNGASYMTECVKCGHERKMSYADLTKRANNKCMECIKVLYAVGDEVAGRRILRLTQDNHGHRCAHMECIVCGHQESQVTFGALARGQGCACGSQAKSAETLQATHGVRHSSQVPGNRTKASTTMQERYGVPHAMQCDTIKTRMLANRSSVEHNGWRSAGEMEIATFVETLGLLPEHGYIAGREVDIIVKSCGIGLEYNGVFWHSETNKKDRMYHLDKLNRATKAGLDLIQIWDWQWIERNDQVQNFLRSRLGRNENRVGVRSCEVRPIDKSVAEKFIDANHIQVAPRKSSLCLGAFSHGELVAIAMFAEHHRGLPVMTLARICTKNNWTVCGFLSKATLVASRHFKMDIVTWTDRCLSTGKGYIAAGYILQETLNPDYFYQKSGKVIKKQNFRKIDERTESQRATDEGMHRVWDCGKLRLVFKYKGEGNEK